MQGARRGTPSRVSRITLQAAGSAKPLHHRGCPVWDIFVLKTFWHHGGPGRGLPKAAFMAPQAGGGGPCSLQLGHPGPRSSHKLTAQPGASLGQCGSALVGHSLGLQTLRRPGLSGPTQRTTHNYTHKSGADGKTHRSLPHKSVLQVSEQ